MKNFRTFEQAKKDLQIYMDIFKGVYTEQPKFYITVVIY